MEQSELRLGRRSSDDSGIGIILFEQDRDSISDHIEVLEELGIRYKIAETLSELKRELLVESNRLLFVDMYVDGVFDLAEVGFPNVRTADRVRTGIAVIRTLVPHLRGNDVPSYILSGYKLAKVAADQLERAESQGMDVGCIPKPQIGDFRALVQRKVDALTVERDREQFLAAEKIIEEWTDGDSLLVARAFGYDPRQQDQWEVRKQDILEDMNNDIKDRGQLIIFIKECLVSVYGLDDLDQEREWLIPRPGEYDSGGFPDAGVI